MKDNPMNQVAYTHLEVKKGENLYTFSMPMNSSLAEACDAAFMFFKAIDNAYKTTVDKEIKDFEEKKEQKKVALKDASADTK